MTVDATTALDAQLEHLRGKDPDWAPFPGFQTKALAAREFEVFLGGAKGPGKSDLILMGATRQVNRPLYKALILRESFPELQEMMRRAHRRFPKAGATWNGESKTYTFPSDGVHETGGIIAFGFCTSVKDTGRYQGGEWAYIGYDELGKCPEERIWEELLKEIRCPDPDVILMARGSGNPGDAGHAWCRRRFITPTNKGTKLNVFRLEVPGLGMLRRTRRFIPGLVTDNPIYANDPQYMATLHALPYRRKQQLLYGDWDVGEGLALEELDEIHFVDEFDAPEHWPCWGALDPGFQHPWVFGGYCVDEGGRVYKLDTLTGRKEYPNGIYDRIVHRFPEVQTWEILLCGPDLMYKPKAAKVNAMQDIPSKGEEFMELGLIFTPWDASPGSRVISLGNLQKWLKWVGQGPDGVDAEPALRFMDTPGNRWCYDQLRSMVLDEKNWEDALKVHADQVTGEGGDDAYDETRGAMSYRPFEAPDLGITPVHDSRVHRKSREIMRRIQEQQQREYMSEPTPGLDHLDPRTAGDPWEDAFG